MMHYRTYINSRSGQGLTPIYMPGQRDQAEALTENGADLEAIDDDGKIPLLIAVSRSS
jgi:ankyrin repeat protein